MSYLNFRISSSFLAYTCSFCLPIIILCSIFVLSEVYPFGEGMVLITDLYHQYVHHYSYILEAVKGDESLLYSWTAGLGSNFIGNIAYYTASPLLIILFFFPERLLPEAVLVLILVKFGLCGLSISYFIRKKFTTIKLYEVVLFSCFYALMSYNITYYYNVMWLDGVILLPLIILSVDAILHNKGITPYVIILSLLFISNFYISYMIGLFVFLYFIIDLLLLKKVKPDYEAKAVFLKFVKGTSISIGLTAFLTIPTFFQLMNSLGYDQQDSHNDFSMNFILKLFSGVFDSVENGSPNIYIGTFVLLLVPIFYICKINWYEKVKWSILFSILAISFVVPPLNLFWHAGDIPNWFPYRYSFIFSFILFYMSLAAFEKVHTIRFKILILPILFSAIMVTVMSFTNEGELNIVANNTTIFLLCVVILMKKLNIKKAAIITLVLYTLIELFFNSAVVYLKVNGELLRPNRDQYTIFDEYKSAIDQIKTLDPMPYFRIETDANKTNNDSLTLDHSSVGHSSSMLDNDLIKTMDSLGIYSRKANYSRKGSTILTDSLFGLKYFVSSSELEDDGYELVSRANKLYIYRNNNYLPIGYPVVENIKNLKIEDIQNPFEFQSKIYQTLFETKDTLFELINPEKIQYQHAKLEGLDNSKKLIGHGKDGDITIKYFLNVNSQSRLYALFDIANAKDMEGLNVFINGKEADEYITSHFIGILELGKFNNEQVVIELHFDEEVVEFASDELFYRINTKNFSKYVNQIDRDAFTITELKGNKMKAHITINEEDQLLFLSIPWDEGWRISIDGEKVKPIKVLGAFMGIPLEKGKYELQMTFIPKGFLAGSFITCISLLIFSVIILRERKKRREVKVIDHDEEVAS
ncbi:YfhO family protein [Alkalihalobacillus sp. AL-G]|uniref:YfhO family protein n=1 Tax=Alkalihalobacillus sp. AL-G TaxID=2926399 RepID=UPI00272B026B|nr:YfhO family protein [Alkalihalobacillus sp. AL-G]WLD93926.1 YfhO family protein [Alkalihalobacillus sp. AL-G]